MGAVRIEMDLVLLAEMFRVGSPGRPYKIIEGLPAEGELVVKEACINEMYGHPARKTLVLVVESDAIPQSSKEGFADIPDQRVVFQTQE